MRLIDADEIIKQFDPNTWQGEMMIAIAKGLPTAYDLDKVVEQLDNLFPLQTAVGTFVSKKNVIRLVKGGGVDE